MISVFELFKIGIGPSSSHTVGPMKAAHQFVADLAAIPGPIARIEVTLLGSLAWTGIGHATDKAVMLGLAGAQPDTVDPDCADAIVAALTRGQPLTLPGASARTLHFDPARDIVYDRKSMPPRHPNTLAVRAFAPDGAEMLAQRWCSIGGGFVIREDAPDGPDASSPAVPHPFANGAELLLRADAAQLTIAELVHANECALRSPATVSLHVDRIIATMMDSVERGMARGGVLPGGLLIRRRAARIRERIEADRLANIRLPHEPMDHVSLFAIAVNEENAAGGRVVTAPTNGAAGVIPAVLRYWRDFCRESPEAGVTEAGVTEAGSTEAGMRDFLLTATAIGGLFKLNASISGAEVGCQGEVGVACSMAAAGLAAALGGSNAQIENAAEIGMEHHLGMTCDPVGGLVQIPCIERNAFGAVKAINAASLALRGDGAHRVSLDQVIATMRQTGADMKHQYKETSLGGLAVNFTAC